MLLGTITSSSWGKWLSKEAILALSLLRMIRQQGGERNNDYRYRRHSALDDGDPR
jgi:hypothetical protein